MRLEPRQGYVAGGLGEQPDIGVHRRQQLPMAVGPASLEVPGPIRTTPSCPPERYSPRTRAGSRKAERHPIDAIREARAAGMPRSAIGTFVCTSGEAARQQYANKVA